MDKNSNAYRGEGREIIFETDDGAQIIRRNGSPAWRNNNPGNLERGKFSISKGAIGDDGRFAVFPDYLTGRKALESLLQTSSYKNLKIEDAMNRYAPGHENDTKAYIEFIENKASVDKKTLMRDLSSSGLTAFADAIERFEGNIEGEIIPIPRKKPIYDATGRFIRD